MASRQASNQDKIQPRAPKCWSCALSAPSISSLPPPHKPSPQGRSGAQGAQVFCFYLFLQSALMLQKAAPGSGPGQRFKRLLARPVVHAAAQPLPRASTLTGAAVLLSAPSLVKASWLNFTALIHSREKSYCVLPDLAEIKSKSEIKENLSS